MARNTTNARKCGGCKRYRRLDKHNLRCYECNGRESKRCQNESPAVLTGRWVLNPVTRIRDYVEDGAA